ncbi:MAG: ribosome-associated protein [Acidimicrobiaceae bacterium]|nr:ribosome-associated protein [Acidimicrobiaceae bacterium]MDQ1365008.1 ribosome-associated protein [Acidimicrobiaceae bacterium]MDQ1377134.1 ribosome-associated protein [Acidimicrobiaceae bacterium]MDQ1411550.1 ribosome-associated protein [Acidimicrobiaceae bacterium]MDQ1418050.1 ribosome-associated protein [Acidimicrobiaceae bacterium]
MTHRPSIDDVRQLSVVAARAAAAKKGEDTLILAVEPLLKITDAFVITSGTNVRQVRTIAEEVEEKVKQDGGPSPLRIEGLDDARWVLMDYGDFVVHVFLDEVRKFYDLERLWADAERWPFESEPAGVGAAPTE